MEDFIRIVLLFFCYSFIGWLWETIYCSLKAGKFVYRGFLVGPITPIYGFGILAVLYLLRPFHHNFLLLYVSATIIVTVLEYFTSFALEKLFHASWWDYHDVPFNLNGRVALPVSLFWGACCVFIVGVVQPHMLDFTDFLAAHFSFYLPIALIAVTMFDAGYTLANMASFQNVTNKLSHAVEKRKNEVEESLLNRKEQVQQHLEWLGYLKDHPDLREKLPHLNFHQRRLLKNFSRLKLDKVKNVDDVRQLVDDLRKKQR